MSGQFAELADLPEPDAHVATRDLPGGLVVTRGAARSA